MEQSSVDDAIGHGNEKRWPDLLLAKRAHKQWKTRAQYKWIERIQSTVLDRQDSRQKWIIFTVLFIVNMLVLFSFFGVLSYVV